MENIFIALMGKIQIPEESACLDKFISMIMCLRKQEVLRRRLHDCKQNT